MPRTPKSRTDDLLKGLFLRIEYKNGSVRASYMAEREAYYVITGLLDFQRVMRISLFRTDGKTVQLKNWLASTKAKIAGDGGSTVSQPGSLAPLSGSRYPWGRGPAK